jgi:cyclopropane-fatty-acyl-phospholipid synthase
MVPALEREVTAGLSPALVSPAQRKIAEMLKLGDIDIGGDRPWDLQVHHPKFYERVLVHGNLGAGEAYMDEWWDVEALDEFFTRIHRADPYNQVGKLNRLALAVRARLFNRQSTRRAGEVAQDHYDLGNDLYQAMLGRRMQYTCAYWRGAGTLDQAQENKLHLICRKLDVTPGMNVLDLGGGFGGLAQFLAVEYGCRVVSYNISRQQVQYGRELCRGLPVRFELRDYRDAEGEPEKFDRVMAVGLCEHIGPKNYRRFFELTHRLLRDKGLFLLHTIGGNYSETYTDPWVDRYIFPNGVIPSVAQLGRAMEGLWTLEDWHNFGPDYDRTLMAWWNNFAQSWPRLRERYGDRFYRMWRYYLLSCAGAFRARKLQLWQLVLSKGDIATYTPVR